jgi:phenylacetate-CoA ligase
MTALMQAIERTPLDRWMCDRLAIPEQALTRTVIDNYHLRALQETLSWARTHSPYYARVLAKGQSDSPCSLNEFSRLPFTCPEDIRAHAPEFLCVSQDKVSRVVTLNSSGTTGTPKRVFFTAEDQERALDFFARGVTAMASPGDRMLIALPGEREGSVGYQLAKGIARAGVVPAPHGLSTNPLDTLKKMDREHVTCIIGLPVHILALARHPSALAANAFRRLRSIVLCSDHVPGSIVRVLRQRSSCEVFEHYGSTEMGLGGGVDCATHRGYHMREADLYFEIVSLQTGEPVPDGEFGEVVFTTIGRTGMPLIRYRTGDISRVLPGPCDCGSIIKRLDRINERIGGSVSLGSHGAIDMAILDEVLFALPGLLDFTASVAKGVPNQLIVTVYGYGAARSETALREALLAVPAVGANCADGELQLRLQLSNQPLPVTGAKRTIEAH